MNFSEFLKSIPMKEKIEGTLTMKIHGKHTIWVWKDEKKQLKVVYGVYITDGRN